MFMLWASVVAFTRFDVAPTVGIREAEDLPTLQRFRSSLDVTDINHLGEAIVREDGTIEYLKTYRLSAKQTRRAYLLQVLAAHSWNLAAPPRRRSG